MPPLETSSLPQVAVLWPATGTDPYGQATVGGAVEVPVRWDWRRAEALDPQGQRVTVDATVVVDRAVPIGSNLWLGALDDWPGTGTGDDSDLVVVVSSQATVDLKGRRTRRELGVKRFRDTLPGGQG